MATADEIRARAQAALAGQETAIKSETQVINAAAAETVPVQSSVTGKTYYHQIPGSRFHYMAGEGIVEELIFLGGRITTDNPDAIAELDKVANKNGSCIYTRADDAKKLSQDQLEAKSDLMAAAIKARDAMVAAGEKVA